MSGLIKMAQLCDNCKTLFFLLVCKYKVLFLVCKYKVKSIKEMFLLLFKQHLYISR